MRADQLGGAMAAAAESIDDTGGNVAVSVIYSTVSRVGIQAMPRSRRPEDWELRGHRTGKVYAGAHDTQLRCSVLSYS